MPKKPRTEEEINHFREKILMYAIELIQEHGYKGLTMRILANRLGVKAVTIYNYYESKDHIYLAVLTRGFQMLYQECAKAYDSEPEPMARLRAMMRAYLNFGLTQSNFYNLMFTWHVPKYRDYLGTPMEKSARYELEESQKVYQLFIKAVRELVEQYVPADEDQIRAYIIYFWSALHGYVAGINNQLLSYMHDNPFSLSETIIDNLFKHIESELKEYIESKGKGL